MAPKYSNFDEHSFRRSVDTALHKVKAILGTAKKPRLAHEDLDHTYDDKYALAEFISNTSVSAQLAVLEQLGLKSEHLATVLKWVNDEHETVTLQFQAEDSCSFLKEESVEVVSSEMEHETVTQHEGRSTIFGVSTGGRSERTKHKVIQKVKEYHWNVSISYKLKMFKGNDPSTAVELQSRTASMEVTTSGGQATGSLRGEADKPIPPIAEKTVHAPVEVQMTWLLQSINPESLSPAFSIKRSAQSCKTPRRNQEVDSAFSFHDSLENWLTEVVSFLDDRLDREILDKHEPIRKPDPKRLEVGTTCVVVDLEEDGDLNGKLVIVREYQATSDRYFVEPANEGDFFGAVSIKKANLRIDIPTQITLDSLDLDNIHIFDPVLPLFENGAILPLPDVNALLDAQKQSIQEVIETVVNKVFPPVSHPNKLVTQAEASLLLLCCHWKDLLDHHKNGLDYIENMLRKQLVQAIGKEVDAQEFDKFMRFHNQKLFGPRFAPKPFTYAIRRPQHYPDGILSISALPNGSAGGQSIETMVRKVSGAESPSILIPINAATSIEMAGDRYLHGWLQHRFESSSSPKFRLEARARQFSSFLLMVGTMAGSDTFDPKAAIILQNKDEVLIPLLTNVLPTAQEFKDAIASLSPEQQAFCRAFREMQLESSVFGVCIVQLKPQLEKLLGLPPGGLTKEIQLTRDLMSLFVDYQIPGDLLSFDGEDTASAADKLAAVKGHVKAVLDVIEAEKTRQLKDAERKADMRQEELFANTPEKREEWAKPAWVSADTDSVDDPAAVEQKRALKALKRMKKSGRAASRRKAATTIAAAVMSGPQASDLSSTKRMIAESKEVGSATLEELQRQREVIANVDHADFRDTFMNEMDFNAETEEQRGASDQLGESSKSGTVTGEDFTLVPKTLDAKFLQLDTDNALRSTALEAGPVWSRLRQESLLSPLRSSSLQKNDVQSEKNQAFDLLDAISRSGTLPVECAELHVVIGVSHCFENDVMGSVIQDNINPIEKVEKSSLILGSTIYGECCAALLADAHVQRLQVSFPSLFIEN